eukprot:SAG22_NODE_212_length_15072_cov_3.109197_10_plen_138_part_00
MLLSKTVVLFLAACLSLPRSAVDDLHPRPEHLLSFVPYGGGQVSKTLSVFPRASTKIIVVVLKDSAFPSESRLSFLALQAIEGQPAGRFEPVSIALSNPGSNLHLTAGRYNVMTLYRHLLALSLHSYNVMIVLNSAA